MNHGVVRKSQYDSLSLVYLPPVYKSLYNHYKICFYFRRLIALAQ